MNLNKNLLLALGFIIIITVYYLIPNASLTASVDNCLENEWDINYEWSIDYELCACADEMNNEFKAEHLCDK